MQHQRDPRRNAFRADLADIRLQEEIKAPQYTEGRPAWVIDPSAPLRREPYADAPLDTQILYGEKVTIFDKRDGWAWVQLHRDDYVGYTPEESLITEEMHPTHKVGAQRTFLFPAPDIKTPPITSLPLNARVEIVSEEGDFFVRKQGGYLHRAHIKPLDAFDTDFVTVAERFVETPYLWGGKQDTGIDCSGLVQVSLDAVGINAPRDSDMQRAETGKALPSPYDLSTLKRGDLIFWQGHVGIMADAKNLLHANAFHMRTAIEPLSEAVERISKTGSEIIAIRRP